jgi:hypothetical protein
MAYTSQDSEWIIARNRENGKSSCVSWEGVDTEAGTSRIRMALRIVISRETDGQYGFWKGM